MSTDDGLPPLREVIATHGISARKNLGQNFLFDLNLTGKIARAAGPLADYTIIEVGPGPGGLTRALLMEGAKKVVAIERDERVLPILNEIKAAYPGRVEVICDDATRVDYHKLVNGPVKIIANLPYNIATVLLVNWLSVQQWPPFFESATLMFQREVAMRIVSEPGSKVYGRLSVLSQWRTQAKKLFDVPAQAFTPPPKVTSSIVQIIPDHKPQFECNIQSLEAVAKAAFGQRRKMLRSSLKAVFADPQTILENCDIEPTMRAEQLGVSDFCRLSQEL